MSRGHGRLQRWLLETGLRQDGTGTTVPALAHFYYGTTTRSRESAVSRALMRLEAEGEVVRATRAAPTTGASPVCWSGAAAPWTGCCGPKVARRGDGRFDPSPLPSARMAVGDPGPNGSVIMRETFLDAAGLPCEPGEAVTVEVEVRYPDGETLRTYGRCEP